MNPETAPQPAPVAVSASVATPIPASTSDSTTPVIRIGTRGSALALAQARQTLALAQRALPERRFELVVIKTTGDKLQTASMARNDASLPKGLFTKELEAALLAKEIDVAVHSLKDLPTEMPDGLALGGILPREDVRDVLLYRRVDWVKFRPKTTLEWSPGGNSRRVAPVLQGLARLPEGATVATSAARRAAQIRAWRSDLRVVEIRGNVGTRLRKLAEQPEFSATLLAMAGLRRLHLELAPDGALRVDPRLPAKVRMEVEPPPPGTYGTILEPNEMLPAVGQGAVALQIRRGDGALENVGLALNHSNTRQAVTAERAFLQAMGGGCQTAVAAWARIVGHQLLLRAGTFEGREPRVVDVAGLPSEAVALGESAAARLR